MDLGVMLSTGKTAVSEISKVAGDGLKNIKEIKENSNSMPEFAKNMNTNIINCKEQADRKIGEFKIYNGSELTKENINGRECYIKSNLDYNQKDDKGMTNLERMENGKCPIDKNGEKIELHHVGQGMESKLAELSQTEHRGGGHDGILHEKNKVSEIYRNKFNTEKSNHWKARAEKIKNS